MKVRCKVCGQKFDKENVYCDHCAAKYGAERSQYDVNLFEDQRSMTEADRQKANRKSDRKSDKKTIKKTAPKRLPKEVSEKLPDFDTLRDLRPSRKTSDDTRGRKRSPKSIFRTIIFFIVFMNIISGVLEDFDFEDLFSSNDDSYVMQEEAVEIAPDDVPDFPMNEDRNFYGDYSDIAVNAEGIYEGRLSTNTYLNFDSRQMRFELKDHDFTGEYQTPIYLTLSKSSDDSAYFFDVWDKNTLKMLGSYTVPIDFNRDDSNTFTGVPTQDIYDGSNVDDLKGDYVDDALYARLALPYTIDNEIYYFDLNVTKVNDDTSELMRLSYLENEYVESFISDDGLISLDIYTYEEAQGYPHSSMYYDGVFVLYDVDNSYPPMPFVINDDSIYASMDYMDTMSLTLRDNDFDEFYYFDNVDTQYYQYYPIEKNDVLYTFTLSADIIWEDDIPTIKGTYSVLPTADDENATFTEFEVEYIEGN